MATSLKKRDWAVLPYNIERISNNYLVSNYFGNWDLLSREEFSKLETLSFDERSLLFNRLYEKGIVLRQDVLPKLIDGFHRLNSHLFKDTSLHIAVVTTRCNLACKYCQTNIPRAQDMDFEVAGRIIKSIFDVKNSHVTLELQGGEPLLNWKIVKFFIENCLKINSNKSLLISMVSNGLLLDQKKIDFLVDNGVGICISLDGPPQVHNKNRVLRNGGGSYSAVISAIKRLKMAYKKKKVSRPLDLLPTITKHSLRFPKEIIDEYVSLGASQIALRPTNKIGVAGTCWKDVGYTPEQFNAFWKEAMDYMISLNKKGIEVRERMACVALKKILKKEDAGFVDCMNPCGAGRSTLAYMPNGDVYPCDESRMVGSDIFKLGNILESEYEQLMKSQNIFSVCQASLVDLWDYNTAYLPWIGTCPVLNYISSGNLVPRISTTPMYKIHHFQLAYIFRKLIEDKNNEKIFSKWIEG